jgi:hypothetical protein
MRFAQVVASCRKFSDAAGDVTVEQVNATITGKPGQEKDGYKGPRS